MSRLQIHKIQLPDTFKISISKFIEGNKSKRTQELGVSGIDFDDYSFSGTFFKKVSVQEKFINPFGQEDSYHYEYYFSQSFNIYSINEKHYLVLSNPQRSLKSFYEYLHSNFRTGFYLDDRKIRLNEVVDKLGSSLSFKVLKAKFTEVSLSTNSKANVEIISSNNAIKEFNAKFGQAYHQLTKVKISYTHNNQPLGMEISQNGSIHIDQDFNDLEFVKGLINILYT